MNFGLTTKVSASDLISTSDRGILLRNLRWHLCLPADVNACFLLTRGPQALQTLFHSYGSTGVLSGPTELSSAMFTKSSAAQHASSELILQTLGEAQEFDIFVKLNTGTVFLNQPAAVHGCPVTGVPS